MPNRKYANSANRELAIKKELEAQGWYAVRASGSHGIADVVAVKPAKNCVNPEHYQVKFVQVKTSQALRERKVVKTAVDSPCGYINVEFHHFPVKNAKFRELARERKEKLKKKVKK